MHFSIPNTNQFPMSNQINRSSKKASNTGNAPTKTKIVLFTCRIRQCCEDFDTQEALIAHKTAVHKRTQCTYCPDLKLVVDLNKHLRDAHNIIQNSMCEHCGQVFSGTRSLLDHIQRKHEVGEPLQCDICKEYFKNRDTIRSHMNYVHIQGPQACPVCTIFWIPCGRSTMLNVPIFFMRKLTGFLYSNFFQFLFFVF